MINDITDFLPKYPNIKNYEEDFLNPYDENFYMGIFKKKEFYDDKLDKIEPEKKENEVLLKHQKIISKFLSSYTPYDQLLLVHEMGTGKTLAAIGAIEQIKKENSTITGAIILAKGKGLLNNFKAEIVSKFGDLYTPENCEFITEDEKNKRITKLVKKFYNFEFTFYIMASQIEKMSDAQIEENFSNKIFVIDEVHNVRMQEEVEKKKIYVYKQIHRLLHNVRNCKVLLMSGTPIKDSIEEFANILNLILPLNSQLPIDTDFITEFFEDKNEDGMYYVKKDRVKILKDKMKGRVSYLRAVSSDIKKVFKGEKNVGNLKHFIVYEDFMSDFQSKSYEKSYNVTDKKAVFNDARQASLFVFPDGSWGVKGFTNKDNIEIKYNVTIKNNKQVSSSHYKLSDLLKGKLKGETDKDTLKNIRKYSSKYAACIENILDAFRNKKKTFVYNKYVEGSGGILFSLILGLFGFEKGNTGSNTKHRRYILLNNVTSTSADIKKLIDKFNESKNLYGEYISVIIGSSVISEGFSLFDIQEEHILTPHWNYSETDQAIARGYRFGSHKNLIDAGVIPVLKIYQYVSIPDENYEDCISIDLKMYETSEIKDVNIKNIQHLIKEASFDCALNYNRNYIEGYDSQRECDYTSCNYSCYEMPSELYKDSLSESKVEEVGEESMEESMEESVEESVEESSDEEEINLSKFKKLSKPSEFIEKKSKDMNTQNILYLCANDKSANMEIPKNEFMLDKIINISHENYYIGDKLTTDIIKNKYQLVFGKDDIELLNFKVLFDVILLEFCPIYFMSKFFAVKFFEDINKILKSTGIVVIPASGDERAKIIESYFNDNNFYTYEIKKIHIWEVYYFKKKEILIEPIKELSKKTEKIILPINTIKWLFSYKNQKSQNIDLSKLEFTKESEYSITPWKEATIVTKKIIDFFASKKITITDATANVGGNSIDFYNNNIENVNSVEIDGVTCEILKNNLSVYGYKTTNVYCADYLNIYMKLNQDCVFFDPPWGGSDYIKHDRMDLFLGETNIMDVIHELFLQKKVSLVVLKAPKNYNLEELKNRFREYTIENIKIFRRQKHSYDVFFIYKQKLDMGDYDGAENNIILDKSTYQLYYNTDKIDILMNKIIELFNKYYFKLDLIMILNYFNEYTLFEVMTALKNIINENKIIYNKYGFPSFLKESNNIYFLTINLTIESTYFSEFYTQNPIILIKTIFLEEISDIYFEKSPEFISQLFKLKNISKMKNIIDKLPKEIVEMILENSIIATEKNIEINKVQRDLILKILSNEYIKITLDDGNTIVVSSLLYQSQEILKCVELNKMGDGWKICNKLYTDAFENELEMKKQKIRENEYGGYHMTYNGDNFCIKESEKLDITDARRINSGKVCQTWKISELLNFMIKIFKVPIPLEKDNLDNNKSIWKDIKKLDTIEKIKDAILKNKILKKLPYTDEEISEIKDISELRIIYYWMRQGAAQICQKLKEFLHEKGMLIYDANCGINKKVKK